MSLQAAEESSSLNKPQIAKLVVKCLTPYFKSGKITSKVLSRVMLHCLSAFLQFRNFSKSLQSNVLMV